MKTNAKQANFLLPEDLLDELRKTVPKREQSKVVVEALRRELKRLRLLKAIETSFGSWRDEDHPELEQGTEPFLRELRKSSRLGRTE
jgi:hypothetical protein